MTLLLFFSPHLTALRNLNHVTKKIINFYHWQISYYEKNHRMSAFLLHVLRQIVKMFCKFNENLCLKALLRPVGFLKACRLF